MAADLTTFEIKPATVPDLKYALSSGLKDFTAAPMFGVFFGGVYALGGAILLYGMFALEMPWLAYPLIIGFSLIGPFVATGLHEVSRRLEHDRTLNWREVLGVIWLQRRRELGWMAFVTLFIFWIWMYQIRTLVAVFFGFSGFATFTGFMEAVLGTSHGITFLLVGHVIGAIISLILYMLTVISFPLLLERDVDFITAMLASIKSVIKSPIVMILWGGFVIVSVVVSAIPAFVGLVVVLPILGHATWHLYRRIVI